MSAPVPEVCSCSALRQAARHVTRFYDEGLRAVGLGLNQYSILAKLDRSGPQTINELSARLVMDRSTVGRLLRPLHKRGLVSIEVAARDRRSRLVTMTAAGQAVMGRARPLWAVAESRFERAFGAGAARELRIVLKRVTTTEFASVRTLPTGTAMGAVREEHRCHPHSSPLNRPMYERWWCRSAVPSSRRSARSGTGR